METETDAIEKTKWHHDQLAARTTECAHARVLKEQRTGQRPADLPFNEAEDTLDHAFAGSFRRRDHQSSACERAPLNAEEISADGLPVKRIHHELTDRSGIVSWPERISALKGCYYIERHIIHQYVKKDEYQ